MLCLTAKTRWFSKKVQAASWCSWHPSHSLYMSLLSLLNQVDLSEWVVLVSSVVTLHCSTAFPVKFNIAEIRKDKANLSKLLVSFEVATSCASFPPALLGLLTNPTHDEAIRLYDAMSGYTPILQWIVYFTHPETHITHLYYLYIIYIIKVQERNLSITCITCISCISCISCIITYKWLV